MSEPSTRLASADCLLRSYFPASIRLQASRAITPFFFATDDDLLLEFPACQAIFANTLFGRRHITLSVVIFPYDSLPNRGTSRLDDRLLVLALCLLVREV